MKNLKEKILKMLFGILNVIVKLFKILPIRNHELFHLQASVDCLKRVINNEKPYPGLDRDEVF